MMSFWTGLYVPSSGAVLFDLHSVTVESDSDVDIYSE